MIGDYRNGGNCRVDRGVPVSSSSVGQCRGLQFYSLSIPGLWILDSFPSHFWVKRLDFDCKRVSVMLNRHVSA